MANTKLRAIREYVSNTVCNCGECGKISKQVTFNVTFADETGCVVANCYFNSVEEANFVVDAVNQQYDAVGESGEHLSKWDFE